MEFDHFRPPANIFEIAIDQLTGVEKAAFSLDSALRKAGVLHIKSRGPEANALEFWAAAIEHIGRIDHRGENPVTLERVPALWNDIRYDPDLSAAYRHSKTAQPLHTDGAYNQTPANICFFYCKSQARAGGQTHFIDADFLCDILRKEEPKLFDRLRSIPVQFGKGTAAGQTVPIIGEDDWGPVLNWNYYRVVPGQSREVIDLSETFFAWLDKRLVRANALSSLRLAAGDCMVFHDLRCLHGRTSFEAEVANERWLWNLNFHWSGHISNTKAALA